MVGLGAIAEQAVTEGQERNGGRPALLSVQASSGQAAVDEEALDAAWASVVERYAIRYSSSVQTGQATVQFRDGAVPVEATIVQQPYATMHRVTLENGSWFDESDSERLAPALVVNTIFWQRMGQPALSTHPTVEILGERPQTGVVIGVVTTSQYENMPRAFLVDSSPARQAMTSDAGAQPGGMQQFGGSGQPPTFEAWVPPALAPQLAKRIESDLTASLGEGAQVSVNRQDYAAARAAIPSCRSMLTGTRAFGGEDMSDTLASVLKSDPDWTLLPTEVPPAMRTLVQRCLVKDRRRRISDISVPIFLLSELDSLAASQVPVAVHDGPRWRRWLPATVAAALSAIIVGAVVWALRPIPSPPVVAHFSFSLPEGQAFRSATRQLVAISPDGTRLAYEANSRIYLRPIGEPEPREIQGTETEGGVHNPMFAPDGQSIAYFEVRSGALKRVPITGGTAATIASNVGLPCGATWDRDDV